MDSKIGLIIQLSGVFLITILTLFLRRSLKVVALKYWTTAWLCLSFSLICLRLAFSFEEYSIPLFSFYFLGEYVFGFMLVAGCRSLFEDYRLHARHEIFILPFIPVAFCLPFLGNDFNLIFNLHSLILAVFFALAFFTLGRSPVRNFGWRVMYVALGLLMLDFLQYFVVFTARQFIEFSTDYLAYNPIVDLVLEILLGFGMVIVLLEEVLADVKKANDKLRTAHEKLEQLAHIDPLTTAFNRHAFHGYLKKQGQDGRKVSGCVGFFDVDNLKAINDVWGHAVGDIAIRAVSRSIRELIRSEDLLFRWGGDEFFVIMIGMDSEIAQKRMKKMDEMLRGVLIDGVNEPLTIGVSHAFMDFAGSAQLEDAIKSADAEMYRRKQKRKTAAEEETNFVPPKTENPANISI